MSAITIGTLAPERLGELAEVDGVVFHYAPTAEDRDLYWARMLEPGRAWAADYAGAMVGTCASHTLRVAVPGGADVAAAGVAVVGVLPTHRRRGIMGRLLAQLFDDARGRGELLALLCPTEGAIYGRYGFGPAVLRTRLEIDTAHGLELRSAVSGEGLRLLGRDEALARLPQIYERTRRRPGMLVRSRTWWDTHALRRAGVVKGAPVPASRIVAAGDEGYAIYSVGGSDNARERRIVDVQELVADGHTAASALLTYLAGIDLTDRVVLRNRPVSDMLSFLAADPSAIRVAGISDAQWLRFVDVAGALTARSWGAAIDLVVELTDGDPLVAGRWRLRSGSEERSVEPTDRPPDLRIQASDLASTYLGSSGVAGLHAAGLIEELCAGAVAALDAALRTSDSPWTLDPF